MHSHSGQKANFDQCRPENIQYAVEWDGVDAPKFQLCPPADAARYSLLELLAVFRALRFNEHFRSISFSGIDLHVLHGLHDEYGTDHVAFKTRLGMNSDMRILLLTDECRSLHRSIL